MVICFGKSQPPIPRHGRISQSPVNGSPLTIGIPFLIDSVSPGHGDDALDEVLVGLESVGAGHG